MGGVRQVTCVAGQDQYRGGVVSGSVSECVCAFVNVTKDILWSEVGRDARAWAGKYIQASFQCMPLSKSVGYPIGAED